MTLIVGLICREGLVVAADGQGTEDTRVKVEHDKIEFDEKSGLVWAVTGEVSTLQPVSDALRSAISSADPKYLQIAANVVAISRKTVAAQIGVLIQDLVIKNDTTISQIVSNRFMVAGLCPEPTIIEV